MPPEDKPGEGTGLGHLRPYPEIVVLVVSVLVGLPLTSVWIGQYTLGVNIERRRPWTG